MAGSSGGKLMREPSGSFYSGRLREEGHKDYFLKN